MNKLFRTALCAVALGALFQPAQAAWPDDKPIEVVVGFVAGGGTDVMARKLVPHLEKRLDGKAKFIVVNKPGAGGEIATTAVARAAADGYTVGVVNVPTYLFLPMMKKTQYSTDDFRLLARVVDDPTVMVVNTKSRFTNLASIVDALRDNPASVTFGHNGIGSNGHLAALILSDLAKVQPNEVSYRGTASQKTDLLGGHLDVGLISAGEVPELHGGGSADLRVVAILSKNRLPALANVPTAAESGFPILMSSERGLAVPKDIPDAIYRSLEAAIAETLKDPEFAASSPGDAPVLSYMSGSAWQKSLDDNTRVLRTLIDKLPKQ